MSLASSYTGKFERPSESMADEKGKVAYRILAYLLENPNAQDTIEGIIEWWLLDRLTRSNITTVKESLEKLVAAGLILENRGEGPRIYYKINRRKVKEISSLLHAQKGTSDAKGK